MTKPDTGIMGGNGVTKDKVKIVEWYIIAAGQGHTKAQNNLGISYYNGDGVKSALSRH